MEVYPLESQKNLALYVHWFIVGGTPNPKMLESIEFKLIIQILFWL